MTEPLTRALSLPLTVWIQDGNEMLKEKEETLQIQKGLQLCHKKQEEVENLVTREQLSFQLTAEKMREVKELQVSAEAECVSIISTLYNVHIVLQESGGLRLKPAQDIGHGFFCAQHQHFSGSQKKSSWTVSISWTMKHSTVFTRAVTHDLYFCLFVTLLCQDTVIQMREKLNSSQADHEAEERHLTATSNEVNKKTDQLRQRLSEGRSAARKQLTQLTIQSSNAIGKLQAVIAKVKSHCVFAVKATTTRCTCSHSVLCCSASG